MQCYEDHECMDGQPFGTSSTGEKVIRTQELYLVLEDCVGYGGQPLDKWMDTNHQQHDYKDRALVLFKELMEGLRYLTEHDVQWVHHDLKPQNILVKRREGKEF